MRPFLQTTKTISTASSLKCSAPILLQAAPHRCYRLQQGQAPFSTHGAPMQASSPGNLIKSTAKAIDNAAATAALKGIEVGETIATKTRETVGKAKETADSGASLPVVDMYGEQDESNLAGKSDQAASVAEKASEQGVHMGNAAAQAKQKAGEKAGEATEEMKHTGEKLKRSVSSGTKKAKGKVVG